MAEASHFCEETWDFCCEVCPDYQRLGQDLVIKLNAFIGREVFNYRKEQQKTKPEKHCRNASAFIGS